MTFAGLIFPLGAPAQQKSNQAAITRLGYIPHPDYVAQLLSDIKTLNDRSERQQEKLKAAEGEERKKLLEDIRLTDQRSMEKQVEVLEFSYIINTDKYDQNTATIRELQQKRKTKEHQMQLSYLISEAAKNQKLAVDMLQESKSYNQAAAKLGSLANAEEKLLQALSQQNEALALLKKGGETASAK